MAAADAPHHRAVPVDEGGKVRVVAPIDVTTEQLAVAKPYAVTHHAANVLDHARRHARPSTSYLPHDAQLIHDFPSSRSGKVTQSHQPPEVDCAAPKRNEVLEVAA